LLVFTDTPGRRRTEEGKTGDKMERPPARKTTRKNIMRIQRFVTVGKIRVAVVWQLAVAGKIITGRGGRVILGKNPQTSTRGQVDVANLAEELDRGMS
jgi:hypothetical protein